MSHVPLRSWLDNEPLVEYEVGIVLLLDLLQPLVVAAEVHLGLVCRGVAFRRQRIAFRISTRMCEVRGQHVGPETTPIQR